MKKLSLALILLLAAVTAVSPTQVTYAATDRFVATTGNDGNDCLSLATACLTIQAAIDKASVGDTVNVASRVQQLATRNRVLVSADVRRAVHGDILCGPLRRVQLRGHSSIEVCNIYPGTHSRAMKLQQKPPEFAPGCQLISPAMRPPAPVPAVRRFDPAP